MNFLQQPNKTTLKQKASLVLAGIFLGFLFLEIALRLGGFFLATVQEYQNSKSLRRNPDYKVLCLGESTTAQTYPPYLEEILNKPAGKERFSVIDKGITGTTTSAILARAQDYLQKYQPHMAVLMIGINDKFSFDIYSPRDPFWKRAFYSLRVVKLIRWILDGLKEMRFDLKIAHLSGSSPQDDFYVQRAIECKNTGDPKKSREYLEKALRVNPRNSHAYSLLAWFEAREDSPHSLELFEKAVALDPKDSFAYSEMGWFYRSHKNLPEAIKNYQKALALNPKSHWFVYNLGLCYEESGQREEAEKTYKEALRLAPTIDRYWLALGMLYEKNGKKEDAEMAFRKAAENYYHPRTIQNYRELVFLLTQHGIIPVCVQYPLRNLVPLKKILEDIPGIFFVDNEAVFQNALKEEPYESYFIDRFGGDFGHCTPKGNRLLAKNIAQTVFQAISSQKPPEEIGEK